MKFILPVLLLVLSNNVFAASYNYLGNCVITADDDVPAKVTLNFYSPELVSETAVKGFVTFVVKMPNGDRSIAYDLTYTLSEDRKSVLTVNEEEGESLSIPFGKDVTVEDKENETTAICNLADPS